MKYVPKLFNSDMVRAIQHLTKKQTRRTKGLKIVNENPDQWKFISLGPNPDNENDPSLYAYFKTGLDTWTYAKSEASIGDVFWVRETLYQNGEMGLEYVADNTAVDEEIIPLDFNVRLDKDGHYKCCQIPSIYMPKALCRTFLEVTNVRIELLHDISEEYAIAEGIEIGDGFEQFKNYGTGYKYANSAIESFFSLWESINGKESLERNPWVWVYYFKKIDKPNDFLI